MNQLERCWNLEFAPVRVYVSMSDKVVDRVMRRLGSRGLGWLKQPPTVEQCETIPNRRFVMILWSEEIDDCVERSRRSWWNQTTGHWRLDTYTISWIQNWRCLEWDLIFTLWQHCVSRLLAQNIVQFIPLNAATNTSTALDGTLASTYFGEMHDVLRCKFSIHWEMLWLQCFLCSRHVLHQLLPPL